MSLLRLTCKCIELTPILDPVLESPALAFRTGIIGLRLQPLGLDLRWKCCPHAGDDLARDAGVAGAARHVHGVVDGGGEGRIGDALVVEAGVFDLLFGTGDGWDGVLYAGVVEHFGARRGHLGERAATVRVDVVNHL